MSSAWVMCGLMLPSGKENGFEEDIYPICKQYTIGWFLFVSFVKFMLPFFMIPNESDAYNMLFFRRSNSKGLPKS